MKLTNPFISEQSIKVFTHNSQSSAVDLDSIPSGDDIVTNPKIYGITAKYLMDRNNKVNIYINPDILQAKMLMSGNSNKLLTYISETLDWNQDYFKLKGLKMKNFMTASNISSRTTVYKAIEELCRYGFIAPDIKQGYYWVNPHRVFRGNRIKTYPDNLIQE